jgi:hypothetical protein
MDPFFYRVWTIVMLVGLTSYVLLKGLHPR